MPTKEIFVKPDLFCTVEGIDVYYTYKDNDAEQNIHAVHQSQNATSFSAVCDFVL